MCQTRNLFFTLLALFTLTSCNTTRYGSLPTWDFKTKNQKQAEAAPDTLSKNTTQPASLPTTENIHNTTYSLPATPIEPASKTKVAILLPLSGTQSHIGDTMLKAAQMALFDVADPNFQLTPYDTQGTADGARQAAEKALHDGTNLVLGPVFSKATRAARDVFHRRNINMIAFSTDWSITDQNTFTIGMLPFDQLDRIISHAADNNLRRIGIIAPDTTYGRAILSAYNILAAEKNLQTIEILTYKPGASHLSKNIRKFTRYDSRTAQREAINLAQNKTITTKATINDIPAPYDAILIAAGGSDAITIANLLTHYDLPPGIVKRLGMGLFDDPNLADEVALRGSWFAAPSPETHKRFEKRYASIYTAPPHRLASLAYDATALAAILAARTINTTGHTNFHRTAILNPNGFAGVDGIFRFLNNGTTQRGLSILTFKNGRITEIDPAPRTFQE